MKLICFDLEGPLTPQDNAYELMKLVPRGGKIFEVLSRYDDLLALEGRPGYEPGDTLALIIPFVAYHKIEEKQISAMGQEARLTPGATELISQLESEQWNTFCITTSYEQFAFSVTQRLGISSEHVACTPLPLRQIQQLSSGDEFALLKQAEDKIVALEPFVDDAKIREYLDYFYWQKLPHSGWGQIMTQVKPIGGRRKVEALENFSTRVGKPFSQWVVVGDSITDCKMLEAVNKTGGLAIAFNASEYALQYATMSLASVRLDDLWIALEAWQKGGRHNVQEVVKDREGAGGTENRGWFHWLDGITDMTPALEIHKRIRRLVRKDAAKLA
jgi:energy-converting hydrogenase A subunit R